MDPETVLQSEISRTENSKDRVTSLVRNTARKAAETKLVDTVSRFVVSGDLRVWGEEGKGQGLQYVVTEGELTPGGEHGTHRRCPAGPSAWDLSSLLTRVPQSM